MKGEFFSRQLSFLPEDMIEDAMQEGTRKQKTLYRILRVAACLAVVIGLLAGIGDWNSGVVTGPGILTVTVYAEDETGIVEVPLKEGIFVEEEQYCTLNLSVAPGLPVGLAVETLDFPSDQIKFDITMNCGIYFDWKNHGDSSLKILHSPFSCSNNVWLYWYYNDDFYKNDEYDHVYTDIIIYCEEKIVGYAVLRFDRMYSDEFYALNPDMAPTGGSNTSYHEENRPVDVYYTSLVKSVSFPKINGEYQDITEEYVRESMNQCHGK